MIRLGLIGISEGNGHPYSWAAIINGYDKKLMLDCGFPVIPQYLSKHKFPEESIKSLSVTHIWTQNIKTSQKISQTTFIPNVVNNYEDMIGNVDGILLARDDAENHLKISLPFLKAGIPIYIDKPLAYSVEEANNILSLQKKKDLIFSCSAFKYAKEVELLKSEIGTLGDIKLIKTTVPKDWEKYSIHAINPVLFLFPKLGKISKNIVWKSQDRVTLIAEFSNGTELQIQSAGKCTIPINLSIYGEHGYKNILIQDTFYAFKKSLMKFEQCILTEESDTKPDELIRNIALLELGMK